MAAIYSALVDKLSGPAKDHLVKDQQRWVAIRSDACVGTKDQVIRCLERHFRRASNNLGSSVTGFIPSSASRRW
jgi:hypothetical protein